MGLLVFVRLPFAEQTVPVEVPVDATVADLKMAIADAGGPTPSGQQVSVGGVGLGDDWTALADTQLSMQCVVHVAAGQRRCPRSVVSVGNNHALALLGTGEVVGWGAREHFWPIPDFGQRVVSVHAGCTHSAAVLEDGTAVGWGEEFEHHAWLDELREVDDYSAGNTVLRTDWAAAAAGGKLTTTGRAPPLERRVLRVACGASSTACVMEGGAVTLCTRTWAVTHVLDGGALDVAVGSEHLAVLMEDGAVHFRGIPEAGRRRASCPDRAVTDAVAVACGSHCSVVLLTSGRLLLFGTAADMDLIESHRYAAISCFCFSFAGVRLDGTLFGAGRRCLANPPDLGGRRVAGAG